MSYCVVSSRPTDADIIIFPSNTYILRCTWAGDRDGQCISLVCWGIRIKPDDHLFLNRTTGIFRVLQTVLNDARTSMALASDKARGPGGASVPFPRVFKSPLNISGVGETALNSPGTAFTHSVPQSHTLTHF